MTLMGDLIPLRRCLCPDGHPHICGGNAIATRSPALAGMFCAGCGADRTVPPSAADPGPCPKCGSTLRSSCRPGENGYPAGLNFRLVDTGGLFGAPIELVTGDGDVTYVPPPA